MVDVTFLLLIFFMVTASFTLQNAVEQGPSELSTLNPKPVVEPQRLEVSIDQHNTYHFQLDDGSSLEAASDNEMRRQMQELVELTQVEQIILVHHGESTHDKFVTAWDAAVTNGVLSIQTQMTELDF